MTENNEQYSTVELRLTKEAADSIRLLKPEQIEEALTMEIRNAQAVVKSRRRGLSLTQTLNDMLKRERMPYIQRTRPEPRPQSLTAQELAQAYNQQHGQPLPDDLADLVPEEFGFEILDTIQGYAQASRGSTMQISCREMGVYFQISKYTTKLNGEFKLPSCFVPSSTHLGSTTYEQYEKRQAKAYGQRLHTNKGLMLFLQRHWANHLLAKYRRKNSFLVPVTQHRKSIVTHIDAFDVDLGFELKLKGSGRKTALAIQHLKVFPKDPDASHVEHYCSTTVPAWKTLIAFNQAMRDHVPHFYNPLDGLSLRPISGEYEYRQRLHCFHKGQPHQRKTKRAFNHYCKLLSKIRKLRG